METSEDEWRRVEMSGDKGVRAGNLDSEDKGGWSHDDSSNFL